MSQLAKRNDFFVEGKTKHLMIGPHGNSEFCFPETLIVS